MFHLSAEPIDTAALTAQMANPRAGAFVIFEGWVRNHNDGHHDVTRLDYEAYETLCQREAEVILAEAQAKFDILEVHCVHRTGSLAIGELAVWVGVTSAHRQAAFEASEYVINQIKARLPIWKKEFYAHGDSGWVNCLACAEHAHDIPLESRYYVRQQFLKEVGLIGQEKLKQARVLVVGAGGLGCAVLPYLAAAGVGHLTIVDDDVVDLTNLHRQVFYTMADVGKPKASVMAERLKALNPLIQVEGKIERVTSQTVERLLCTQDVILDCSDNFETRFLLNDTVVSQGVPLLTAGIYQYEGELQWISPKQGSACLRCLWPEMPEEGCVGSCAEVGVLGAVPGVLGTLQAMETLKWLLGLDTPLLTGTLYLDLQTLQARTLQRVKNPFCSACRTLQNEAETLPARENHARGPEHLDPDDVVWIDLRESWEKGSERLPVKAMALPYSEADWMQLDLPREKPIVLVCPKGARSRLVADQLRQRGFGEVTAMAIKDLPVFLVACD